MYNVKTLEVIIATRTLIEYCKDHTNSCGDCPFYRKNNGEWTGCIFSGDSPEYWEIERV